MIKDKRALPFGDNTLKMSLAIEASDPNCFADSVLFSLHWYKNTNLVCFSTSLSHLLGIAFKAMVCCI